MRHDPGCNLLEGLPRWPALDEATEDLFAAVAGGDEDAAARAIARGANLEAIEPYRAEGQEVAGGNTPLQLACSTWPGQPVNLGVIAFLLAAGANPNANRSLSGLPLRRLASCLPSNAVQAAGILFQAGAIADAGMVAEALLAERLWVDPFVSPHSIPLASAIWEMLPEDERQHLDPHLPTQLIGMGGGPIGEASVMRAKWVLDRLAGMALETAPAISGQPGVTRRGMRVH